MIKVANPDKLQNCIDYVYNKYNLIDHYKYDIDKNEKNFCSGYGEILLPGILKLIENIDITSDDVFLDLGSGLGKLCISFLLLTRIKHSIGIELEKNRYNISCLARKKFMPYIANRRLDFYNYNIVDYDLTKANIIYIGSLCFSDKLLKIISDKINHHSSIKYVITFNKLPDTYLKLMKELIIPCSWKNNEILYIYEK